MVNYSDWQEEGTCIPDRNSDLIYRRIVRFDNEGAFGGLPEQPRILSVGCRDAYELHVLTQHKGYTNTVGIDISRKMVAVSMLLTNVDVRHDRVEELRTIKDNSVDIALCFHVLEHVEILKDAFISLRRVLKNASKILVVLPEELPVKSKYHVHAFRSIEQGRDLLNGNGFIVEKSFVIEANPTEFCYIARREG